MRRTTSAAVCTLLAGVPFALANAAETAPCPLKEVGSLDLVLRENDSYNVPVHLDDQPMVMTIDTGSTGTSITVATAKKLGLDVTPVQDARMFLNDIKINSSVNLKSFGLGDIELDDMPVWVLPDQLVDKGIAGLIGADTLKSFDVEFDPAHSKFNFFVPNTCTTDAAYWTHGAATAVPITLDHGSHISAEATLDGKPVTLLFDTGAFNSIMSIDVAEDLFGFRSDDPRLQSTGSQNINGSKATATYRFPFGSLNLQGLTISHPDIELLPRDLFPYGFRDQTRIILGMNVLRRLRMYVAYKQRVIYLSDASAQ